MTMALRTWRGRLTLVMGTVLTALALVALQSGSAAAGETATASGTRTVNIEDFSFRPATLTIGAGTKVAFTNSDGVMHTATRAGSFDTRSIKPGRSAIVRFTHKGTFRYHCTIHPTMRGKVVVK